MICRSGDFEHSVHLLPRSIVRVVEHVFPEEKISTETCAIVTVQKTEHDLLLMGEVVENEKNACLEKFFLWGQRIRQEIGDSYWTDLIDPCSGYPLNSMRGNTIYSEIEGIQTFLKYQQCKVGNCSVVMHPEWRSHIYPATMFSNAPIEVVRAACQAVPFEGK